MSDQSKLALLSDSLVSDTIRSAGAAKSFAAGGKVSLRKRPRIKVDRTHDDPYLAGVSQDHRCLYIDTRVPKTMTVKGKSFDPARYLAIHETEERKHMDAGMKYQPAHRLALKAERNAVEADGLDWTGYQEQMHALAAVTQREKPALRHPPRDLYKGPFPRSEAKALTREAKSFEEGGPVEDEPEEPESGPWDDYQSEEAGPWDDYKTEYSAPVEAAKRAGKAVLPGLGSLPAIAAGARLGAMGGAAVAGPPGAFVGGIGGGLLGAAAVNPQLRQFQEYMLNKLGWNTDPEKEAAFQREHPTMAAGADIAGSMAGMSPSAGAGAASRLLMGGAQGVIEAGSEYLHTGEMDPSTIAMATAAGAAFPGLNKVGQKAWNVGERAVGNRAQPGQPGRPDMKALPAPPDFTTSAEGETARYQPGDDQVFADAKAPRKGTSSEGTRPIYDEPTTMYQRTPEGPWEEAQPRAENAAAMEPPVTPSVEGQSQPGTAPMDNVALPAGGDNTFAPAQKTVEFIATSKREATPARNTGSTLATSHVQAPPPTNPATVGSNPEHPLSVGSDRNYRADSMFSPASKVSAFLAKKTAEPGTLPTATTGDPAKMNISPEIEAAMTGKPPEVSPEPVSQPAEIRPQAETPPVPEPPVQVTNKQPEPEPFSQPLPEETGIPEAAVTDTVTKLRNAGLDTVADRLEKEPAKEPQARRILADLTAQDYEGMPIDAAKAQQARRMLERAQNPEETAAAEQLFEEARNPLAKEQQEQLATAQTEKAATRREAEGQVAKVGEETVTAASQRKATLIKRAADAAQAAFDTFPPKDDISLTDRLRSALAHAKEANLNVDPLNPLPRKRTAAQEWLNEARKLVGTPENPREPKTAALLKFLGTERMLRSGAQGAAREVRKMNAVESDVANNKRRVTENVGSDTVREWLDNLPEGERGQWEKDFGGSEKDPGDFDTENWDVGSTAGKKPGIDYYDRAAKFWTKEDGAFNPQNFMRDIRGMFGTRNQSYARRFSAREPASWREDRAFSLGEGLGKVRKVEDNHWLDSEGEASTRPQPLKDANEAIYLAKEKGEIDSLPAAIKALYDQHLKPTMDEVDHLYEQIHGIDPSLLGEKVANYISRIPKGLHPDFGGDPVANVFATRRRGLKLSASQTMQREFMAIEDPQGNRTVVNESPEGYREWHNQRSVDRQNASFEPKAGTTFRAHDGTVYTVKDALTPEIEQHALFKNGEPARYYKNAIMSAYIARAELRSILTHLQYLESIKPQLKAEKLATNNAMEAQQWAKAGEPWEKTLMPQMKDWYMTPRIREVFDDFSSPGLFPRENTPNGVLQAARYASEVVTKLLFLNPLFHIANVGTHWFVAHGWNWLDVPQYKAEAVRGINAIRSVLSQDTAIAGHPFADKLGINNVELRRFQDEMRRHGAGTQYGGVLNQNRWHNIAQAAGEAIASNPSKWDPIARVMGITAKDLGRAIYRGSSKVMWAANDVFYTQLVMSKMEKNGMNMADAIRETEKHFPAYKVPSRVISGENMGRWISQALRDNTAFAFGPYHYGVFNSYAHIVKDTVKGTGQERINAIGNMFALGILAYAVYPAWDAAIKYITGNPHAEARRRGPLSLPEHIKRAFQGKEDMLNTTPTSVLTPSPLLTGAAQMFANRDFAGRPLIEPGDVSSAMHGDVRAAGRVAVQGASSAAKAFVPPYAMAARAMENKSGSALAGLRDQQLLDAKTPSPAAIRYEAQAARIKRAAAEARARKGNRGFEENVYNRLTK